MVKKTINWLWLFKRWFPLLIILSLFLLFYSLDLHQPLNLETIKAQRIELLTWTKSHFTQSVLIFITIYVTIVTISVPGATLLTLMGGFLFGPILGSLLVIFSATLGACLLFFAVKSALGEWFAKRLNRWVIRLRMGFNQHAFFYLLLLRLIPIMPFWIVNIVPALLGIPFLTYLSATIIGITPGVMIYIMIGNGFNQLLSMQNTSYLTLIKEPVIFYPLLALLAFSILCLIAYILMNQQKRYKK